MKTILSAALAILLTASSGYSQTAGNCFRMTTEEEQAAGLPIVIQVESCHSALERNVCVHLAGRNVFRPELDQRYIYVNHCTKYDQFDEREKP
ncbi:MAG: hypothetical protein ACTFAK_11070 [Candidatus Electronema sp. VV]